MAGDREQLFDPSLDQLEAQTLSDYAPAAIGLVRAVDQRQHALASGWGGPPTSRFCGALAAGTTSVVPYRVPPGTEWVQVVSLISGAGLVTYTTSADAQGTAAYAANTSALNSIWDRVTTVVSSGPPPSGSTADTTVSRALKVATASWNWQDVDVTIVVANYAGGGVYLCAYDFIPWRVRQ